jgi:hypothetical protein
MEISFTQSPQYPHQHLGNRSLLLPQYFQKVSPIPSNDNINKPPTDSLLPLLNQAKVFSKLQNIPTPSIPFNLSKNKSRKNPLLKASYLCLNNILSFDK